MNKIKNLLYLFSGLYAVEMLVCNITDLFSSDPFKSSKIDYLLSALGSGMYLWIMFHVLTHINL